MSLKILMLAGSTANHARVQAWAHAASQAGAEVAVAAPDAVFDAARLEVRRIAAQVDPAWAAPKTIVAALAGAILRKTPRIERMLRVERALFSAGEPADVYLTHGLEALAVAVQLRVRHGGKVIFDVHAPSDPTGSWWDYAAMSVAERLLIHEADVVIAATGPLAAQLVAEYGIPPPVTLETAPALGEAGDAGMPPQDDVLGETLSPVALRRLLGLTS